MGKGHDATWITEALFNVEARRRHQLLHHSIVYRCTDKPRAVEQKHNDLTIPHIKDEYSHWRTAQSKKKAKESVKTFQDALARAGQCIKEADEHFTAYEVAMRAEDQEKMDEMDDAVHERGLKEFQKIRQSYHRDLPAILHALKKMKGECTDGPPVNERTCSSKDSKRSVHLDI